MLLICRPFGNVDAVSGPQGSLERGFSRFPEAGRGIIADVDCLWHEHDLCKESGSDEDERNPLRPAPAERGVVNNCTAYDTTCEWGNDNSKRRHANLLSLLVAEELIYWISTAGITRHIGIAPYYICNTSRSQAPEGRAAKPLDDTSHHTCRVGLS